MNSRNIYLETFNKNFDEALRFIKLKDYDNASRQLARATEVLGEYFLSDEQAVGKNGRLYIDKLYDCVLTLKKAAKKQAAEKARKGLNEQAADKSGKKLTPEEKILGKTASGDEEATAVFKAMDVPDISFDDVVGLESVKEAVRDKIIKPRLYPEIYEKYRINSGGGILLYGAPGVGKTMIAKAIAHEVNASFYSIKCSSLVGKFFGETEHNIKELFDTARAQKNAVIFFDEFEAIATKRDTTNSSVMKRVVPELLAQIDGVEGKKGSNILCLAATNIPWEIDSAFLRPGRFDESIYISLPDTEARIALFKKNLNGVPTALDIDYALLAERTEGFNPADITEIVKKAKINVAKNEIDRPNEQHEIAMADIVKVLDSYSSSVNPNDIEKIMKWKDKKVK